MSTFQNPHAMQHQGMVHGQPMGQGGVPHPGQAMGQAMQMHPGNNPGIQHAQGGPMMGMAPGMGGPNAHTLSHLNAGQMAHQNMQQCKSS
jgi:hypothetical protein